MAKWRDGLWAFASVLPLLLLSIFWHSGNPVWPIFDAAGYFHTTQNMAEHLPLAWLSEVWFRPTLFPLLGVPAWILSSGDVLLSLASTMSFLMGLFAIFLYGCLREFVSSPRACLGTWLVGSFPFILQMSYEYMIELPFLAAALAAIWALYRSGGWQRNLPSCLAGVAWGWCVALRPAEAVLCFFVPLLLTFAWSFRQGRVKGKNFFAFLFLALLIVTPVIFMRYRELANWAWFASWGAFARNIEFLGGTGVGFWPKAIKSLFGWPGLFLLATALALGVSAEFRRLKSSPWLLILLILIFLPILVVSLSYASEVRRYFVPALSALILSGLYLLRLRGRNGRFALVFMALVTAVNMVYSAHELEALPLYGWERRPPRLNEDLRPHFFKRIALLLENEGEVRVATVPFGMGGDTQLADPNGLNVWAVSLQKKWRFDGCVRFFEPMDLAARHQANRENFRFLIVGPIEQNTEPHYASYDYAKALELAWQEGRLKDWGLSLAGIIEVPPLYNGTTRFLLLKFD